MSLCPGGPGEALIIHPLGLTRKWIKGWQFKIICSELVGVAPDNIHYLIV